MPASHMHTDSCPCCSTSYLPGSDWEKQVFWALPLTKTRTKHLESAWFSPEYCDHLGNKLVEGRPFSLSVNLTSNKSFFFFFKNLILSFHFPFITSSSLAGNVLAGQLPVILSQNLLLTGSEAWLDSSECLGEKVHYSMSHHSRV